MSAQLTPQDLADTMIRANYRRQLHRGHWRVAWWHPDNFYPLIMRNGTADRRAMLREATGMRRPPYSAETWQEIVMLLPAVPSVMEFEAARVRTAAESHSRYDGAMLKQQDTTHEHDTNGRGR